MSNLRTVTGFLMLTMFMAGTAFSQGKGERPARTLLAHRVYFSLNDRSDAAREQLVAAPAIICVSQERFLPKPPMGIRATDEGVKQPG